MLCLLVTFPLVYVCVCVRACMRACVQYPAGDMLLTISTEACFVELYCLKIV